MSTSPAPIHRLRAALTLLGLPEEPLGVLLVQVEENLRAGAIEALLTELSPADIQALGVTLQGGADEQAILTWLRERIPELDGVIRGLVSQHIERIITSLEQFDSLDSPGCAAYLLELASGTEE